MFWEACSRAESVPERRWPWFTGLGLVIWLGGAWYFYQDNEKTFAEARNRGVEILSTDEKTGLVTARDKQTGKIITMDFNDIGRDAVHVGVIGMPAWAPAYPSIEDSEPSQGGSFTFSTADSVAQVARFYESEFREAGMTVDRQSGPAGVTLSARDAARVAPSSWWPERRSLLPLATPLATP